MQQYIGGADEAGKGALYGSAVIAFVSASNSALEAICKNFNIKDSKLLTRKYILDTYNKLKDVVVHKFIYLTPQEIDSINLNTLLTEKYAEVIKGTSCTKVYIDCPIHDPKKFEQIIFNVTKVHIVSEHKADLKYKIVSLASIFAKAKRQLIVDQIIKLTNVDIGSGYPSDPKTKLAVAKHSIVLEKYIRKKWKLNTT